MSLLLEDPLQPVLEMPSDLALWQRCEQLADPQMRWQIYLHQLAWSALRPWLKQELSEYESEAEVSLWPEREPWDIWQVVEGLAIKLGQKRIVVMLSEATDSAALRVPQEWVDLPDWTADYYLAARLDIDNQQLTLWGYTSRDLLKQQGLYDAAERTYCLLEENIIKDFSVFWVAYQVEALAPIEEKSLMAIRGAIANQLLQRLATKAAPRLEIPFDQWGALLRDTRWRKGLYQKRQTITAPTKTVNLGNWVKQATSQAARAVESLSELKTSEWTSLVHLSPQMPVAFRSSVGLATTSPATAQGKIISLTTSTETVELMLTVSVNITEDGRRNICIQLHPSTTNSKLKSSDLQELLLPEGLLLSLNLPEEESPLQLVKVGNRDNYIQLPPFRCDAEKKFSVHVQLSDSIVKENFVS